MDVLLIALLTLLNGAFAMSELALTASRKARLTSMADDGDRGAMRSGGDRGRGMESGDRALRAFDRIDQNDDGQIDEAELTAMQSRMQRMMPRQDN